MPDPSLIIRGVELASIASFSGISAAAAWAERRAADHSPVPRLRRLAFVAGSTAVASHAVRFVDRASEMLDSAVTSLGASDFALIAVRTGFGKVWVLQGALLIAAIAALAAQRAPRVAASLGCSALVVFPLAGHIFAEARGIVPELANVIHVLLAGMWFGGLAAILTMRLATDNDGNRLLVPMLTRFSSFALPAMIALLATGGVLAGETVGRWAALFGTEYGILLTVKIVAVGSVLVSAARIRQRLFPRANATGGFGSLVRTLHVELAFASGVVLLAGLISQTVPASHADIDWWLPFRLVPDIAWYRSGVPAQVMVGAAVCVLSTILAFRCYARAPRMVTVAGAAAGILGAMVALEAVAVRAYPTTYDRPPIAYGAEEIAAGRTIFLDHCTGCHGVTGRGDGPKANGLIPPPADLTAPHAGEHTAGDMFWWLTHGRSASAMPGFANVLDDTERWRLTMYVMALSHGHRARVIAGQAVPRQPWLPSIDFRYKGADGSISRFIEPQDKSSKLLVVANDDSAMERIRLLMSAAPEFAAARAEVVLVLSQALAGTATPPVFRPSLRVVIDKQGEIADAWSHYRRTLNHPDLHDQNRFPPIVEHLIDRFGFVRARWRGDEGGGLPAPAFVIDSIRILADEPEIRALDEHLH
ncbi:MAG: CopD family protein [Betaproteobacteria bacterium]|nr:CopD family protein [Betaproteobacteria bacterium]